MSKISEKIFESFFEEMYNALMKVFPKAIIPTTKSRIDLFASKRDLGVRTILLGKT